MSQDRSELSEWHLPAAASGALQLARQLAQPAAWAERLSARGRPLVVGSFGAEIAQRFHTVSAPGTLALSLAERFLPSASQSSSSELTLAPRGALARDVGVARWSDPLPAPLATNADSNVASAPLMGELSAFGWGAPASASPTQPAGLPIATAPAAWPTGTPHVARRVERAADPPSHASSQPLRNLAAHPVTPPDRSASAASELLRRQTSDLPVPTPQDTSNVSEASSAISADTTPSSRPTAYADQRAEIQPSDEPPTISRTIRSPAARSSDAPPRVSTAPLPALPASHAASIARAAAPGRSANLSPDLLFLRPTVLRSTALLRPLPPDPLQRMGVVPQGVDLAAAPPLGADLPPTMLATSLPLAQAAHETSAPTDPANAPVVRRADTGIEDALPLAPNTSTMLAAADAADPTAAANIPEARVEPAAALPEPEIARSPAASMPEIARSEAGASPAAPAIDAAPQISTLSHAAAFVAAPTSLTTLVLRRHAGGNPTAGSAPLILLRTQPPSAPLLGRVAERAWRSESTRRVDQSSAASGAGFEIPSIGRSAFETPTISRSAAVVPFPLARMPEQMTVNALALSRLEPIASTSIGELNAPMTAHAANPGPIARAADADMFPLAAPGEPNTPMPSRAADPEPLARVADWGAFPLLQRSAATASFAQQTGGSLMLRRSLASGDQPAASSMGVPPLAAAVWRSGDMHSSSSSADTGLGRVTFGAPAGFEPPSAGGGYEQWAIPELASESGVSVARLADLNDGELPLHQRQLAMPSAGIYPAASAYAAQSLDLAQPSHAEVQRIPSDMPAPAPPQPDGAPAPGTAQPGSANVEVIAQKVYEHLRRRLLIEHERRGRPL